MENLTTTTIQFLTDVSGTTALTVAAQKGRTQCVQKLLLAGGDVRSIKGEALEPDGKECKLEYRYDLDMKEGSTGEIYGVAGEGCMEGGRGEGRNSY